MLLLLFSLFFRFYKKYRVSNLISLFLLFWIWLIGCTPFSQLLLTNLEHQYYPLRVEEVKTDSVNILVLGAGHSISNDQSNLGQLTQVSQVRLTEGVRLKRLLKNSLLILSGSPGRIGSVSQAEVTALAALELGVSAEDTSQLRSPTNTEEEILAYKDRFETDRLCVLVTSANHMPRAIFLCEKVGINVLPAPTDFHVNKMDDKSLADFSPSLQKIHHFQIVLREYAAKWYLRWKS
jgi:uncharacterized SAM-binding protein YcdF (DUF218 family)